MTTMIFGGLRPASSPRSDKTGFSLGAVVGHAGEVWRLWKAERALAALDDAALHDIGVSRAEIRHAVRTGERS